MALKTTCIAASILSACAVANADIVYSGVLDLTVETGENLDVDINGNMWQLGILDETAARNFDSGDEIGTLTSVLNMYPLGSGDENINLVMHDYVSGEGNFDANGTGFIGFGFGGGIDFNYG